MEPFLKHRRGRRLKHQRVRRQREPDPGYIHDLLGRTVEQMNADGSTVKTTYNKRGGTAVTGQNGYATEYTYSAVGARVENTQVRENQNAGCQNSSLIDGSLGVDYMDYLTDLCAALQRVFETEVGTTVQNNYETVTKHYIVD